MLKLLFLAYNKNRKSVAIISLYGKAQKNIKFIMYLFDNVINFSYHKGK